jgi:hypothetical protein
MRVLIHVRTMHEGVEEQLSFSKAMAYASLQIFKQDITVVLRHCLTRTFE